MGLKQKVITADLSELAFDISEEDFTEESDYGRGLALMLLEKNVDLSAERLDEGNALVFVPGLFVSSSAPSSCRMNVVTKRGAGQGVHVSNITGDMPHRLASSGVSALVIKGKAKNAGTVLFINDGKPEFHSMPELMGIKIPDIIRILRNKFGEDTAITGTGTAADACLPLATVFTTYPKGIPPYGCPRNSFGDIAGSKNLKAVIVKSSGLFHTDYADKETFSKLSPKLSEIIRSDKICGGALPGLGSIAIMKILKNKADIPEIKKQGDRQSFTQNVVKINNNCSPVCVIGCLNRSGREALVDGYQDVPEVSEVDGAVVNSFGFKDDLLVQKLMAKAFEIGLNATEFVYTAKVYFEAVGGCTENVNADDIYNLMLEVEKLSVLGRTMAGGSPKVYELFKDRPNLKPLVSKPSITQEKDFNVDIKKPAGLENVPDTELLYMEIFLLENLGICIFTSFAVLNNEEALEILGRMFKAKTGVGLSVTELLKYSAKCIDKEISFHEKSALKSAGMTVPEFTKVLYRYFGEEK